MTTSTAKTAKIQIERPHIAQQQILNNLKRFNVVCAGRRTGKTRLALIRSLAPMMDGLPIAYFSPTYKMLTDFWREAEQLYKPIIINTSKAEHRFEIQTGGSFQMWSLDSAETVRGRKYALALIDEAAMVNDLENAWAAVIRPTLTDYEGSADFYSTPKGLNYFHSLYSRGLDELATDWQSFHYPTASNPFIKQTEINSAQLDLPFDVFRQEYLAEFIQGEGAVFRNITANLTKERTLPEHHQNHTIVLGGDWGQVNDFTVLSVVCETCKQEVDFDRFNQIDWEFQRAKALAIMDKWNVKFALFEENSIGSPNLEALQKSCSRNIRGFMTTASSKPPLIQSLALALEQQEIKWLDIPIATRELEAYEAKRSDITGRISYNSPQGFHDDTVMARAIAREAIEQRKRSTITQTEFRF